jgi:hypothetical protein
MDAGRWTLDGGLTMQVPQKLGACADLLYRLRAKRLAAETKITAMLKDEAVLKDHLIAHLRADDADGVIGRAAKVVVNSERVAKVEDWDKFYAHIRKTGHFELLQRRPADTAVRERWDAEEQVPGVVPFKIFKVSITKR